MAKSILSAPHFHNEEAAFAYVEARVWPNGPVCPHCGVIAEHYRIKGKTTRVGLRKCKDCRKPFTVRMKTIFESSHVGLHLWLQAIFLVAASKKGISANQLHRTLGVTLKTAWFMGHRIREAMKSNDSSLLGGDGKIVEADEAYIFTESDKANTGRHGAAMKQANKIVSLVERKGKVRSMHVADVRGENLKAVLESQIAKETHVMTDASPRYNLLKRENEFHQYSQINHSKKIYAVGEIHTNTVEGYFSVMKRGLIGTYHHVSTFHLHRYLSEFDFRYNNRIANGVDDQARATNLLKGIVGKRLMYQIPR